MRASVPVASCLIVGILLAGCGGGSSATTTVTSSAAPVASVAKPQPTASTPSPPASPPSTHHRSAHLSRAARAFLVKGGDNSIPEYGREASASERARAETALATFMRARARGEWSVVCSLLASGTRAQMQQIGQHAFKAKGGPFGCARMVKTLGGPVANRKDLLAHVVALRVKGKTAFALFRGPRGGKYVSTMHEEGGSWKVSELTPPEPYPLGTLPPASEQ